MENGKKSSFDKPLDSYKEFYPEKCLLFNTLAEFETKYSEDEDQFFD